MSTLPINYMEVLNQVTAERDELQKRIDAVMALKGPAGSHPHCEDLNNGYFSCLNQVKALLAEPRFNIYAPASTPGWIVLDDQEGHEQIAHFTGPDAKRYAREFCDRLNRGGPE